MDKFLRYHPNRCLECPELLSEATAGDRCAACEERAQQIRAEAAGDTRRVAGRHDPVDEEPKARKALTPAPPVD